MIYNKIIPTQLLYLVDGKFEEDVEDRCIPIAITDCSQPKENDHLHQLQWNKCALDKNN